MFKHEYIQNYIQTGATFEYYSSGRGIYPSSYLEYAKQDLADGSDRRHLVNAVGNAKRAFHFQTEMLCDAFGWQILHGGKLVGFPKRLEYLGRCGVLSPNILRKLNKKRNDIEHDYYIPSIEEAEDYIDIVELYLMATKDLLDRFPEEVEWELMKDEEYDASLGLPDIVITRISLLKGEVSVSVGSEEIKKYIKDKNYFDWLSSIVEHYVL